MDNRIETFLYEHENELYEDILRLVGIPSVSEDREGARRALREFLTMTRSAGFSVSEAAGGDVGVAVLEPDESEIPEVRPPRETLGILGHVDVVDPGDPSAWTHSPWGEISDGAVWGRGTLDDKGPLVVCLWAIKALREFGVRFRRRVSFIVGTMEEIDWLDMEAYRREAEPPDFGFTPDGEFPVINREKGHCDVVLSFDRDRHRTLGNFEIVDFEAGAASNVVPDSAGARLRFAGSGGDGAPESLRNSLASLPEAERAAIRIEPENDGTVTVRAKGKAAHSSLPEQGDNALVRLCAFLARLGRNGLVDFLSTFFADGPYPQALGLQTRSEYARGEYIGLTSASPDLVKTAGGAFVLTVNLRMSYGQTEQELCAAFEEHQGRFGYSFHLEQFLPALFIPKDRPFMRALMNAYEGRTGRPGEFILAPGTSYAKAMPGIAAFGPVLPGHEDLCHVADERMSFEEIRTCAMIYADAIAALVSSPESMA